MDWKTYCWVGNVDDERVRSRDEDLRGMREG